MKLVSFGEIIWDVYESGKTLGGAPLNLAAHAALLGMESRLVSAVGADALGEEALSRIRALGVECDCVCVCDASPTGACRVTLCDGVPEYRIDAESAYDHVRAPSERLCAEVIAFGSLALRAEHNRRILSDILMHGAFSEVYADVNIRAPFFSVQSLSFCLENATVLKISDEELPQLTECILGRAMDIHDAQRELLARYRNLKIILITKGSRGSCAYVCSEQKEITCPAFPTQLVSTVGAGDSFGAGFLARYLAGEGIEDALRFASRISAYVCSVKESIPTSLPMSLR